MNMNKNDIKELIEKELIRANDIWPLFASNHEGYAIMKEEFLEAENEFQSISEKFDRFEEAVMYDEILEDRRYAKELKKKTINCISELTQFAAMCDKYLRYKRPERMAANDVLNAGKKKTDVLGEELDE